MSQSDFSTLELQPELLKNIDSLGYEQMTPIQEQSLPHILAGKDVIAQAKTGSGKTAAFGLGLLQKLDLSNLSVQSLVLCPTRELADQVALALRQFARTLPNVKITTLCGGMPYRAQTSSIEHGAHIVVGTPGRIGKHLRKQTLKLKDLTTLVLDEGDRMLEMGFQEELDAIIEELPPQRQTLLFSATYPPKIQAIAERIMSEPEMVKVESTHDDSSIEQHFYKVGNDRQRFYALRLLLMQYSPESAVVFCTTKIEVQEVLYDLKESGFDAVALHGDLEQRDRDETMVRFANKSSSILVATDVAARGLDVDSIDLVINYHISRELEVYVHRIGRTGRAGSKGVACSLFSDRESHKLSLLETYLKQELKPEALPDKSVLDKPQVRAQMVTLKIKAGKKQKFRAGNVLGVLTGANGLEASQVGKIHIGDFYSYVAVSHKKEKLALKKFEEEKWKGKAIQAWLFQG